MAQINKYIVRLYRAKVPFVFPELDEEYGAIVKAEKDRKLQTLFPQESIPKSASCYHQPHMLFKDVEKGIYHDHVVPFTSDLNGKVEVDPAVYGRENAEKIAKWMIKTVKNMEPRVHLDTEYGLEFETPIESSPTVTRQEVLAILVEQRDKDKKSVKAIK